jgi:hypothetical protein
LHIVRPFVAGLALVCASVVVHAQTTAPTFSADGWRMLRWPMSLDETRAALAAAHAAFTTDDRTGMFPGRGAGFAEVSFTTLRIHEADREIAVEYENYHLQEVRVIARRPSRASAEQELARLRQQWGEPSTRATVVGLAPGTDYTWTNATTRLVLHVVRVPSSTDWFATQVWSPAVPWPSWR